MSGNEDTPAMNPPARTPTVMVVDDDRDTVTILSRYLQREGFTPVPATSGADCLKLIRDHPIDLILLDLMMPEMDGFEVVRVLKNSTDTAEIPVIMVTARDDMDARAEGMRLGVSDFLAKPVFRRQLASRIRAQLDAVAAGRRAIEAITHLESARRRR